MIGIYTITNTVNGKIYVGCSINVENRWNEHVYSLNRKVHENSKLQRAWNKYGEYSFKHELLVECEPEHLYSEEHWWCNTLQVHKDIYGYNIRPTHPEGKPGLSKESRKKLSEVQKQVWKNNPERAIEQSKRMKGKQYGIGHIITLESRVKINEGKKSAYYSSEARKRMGHMKGKTHSDKVRKLISDSSKGRKMSEENRQAFIKRNIGNTYGKGRIKKEEELEKMRIANKKRKLEGWISPLKNRKRPKEMMKKIAEFNTKKIVCYNEDNTIYKIYNSIVHVIEEHEIKCSNIQVRRSIKNGKIYRNKYWKYENTNN